MRSGCSAVLSVLLSLTLPGVASAQYPPSPGPSPDVGTVTFGTPGAVILVQGSNWSPGTIARIRIEPRSRGASGTSRAAQATRVAVDRSGAFATRIELPPDLEPGIYRLVQSGVDAQGRQVERTERLAVLPADQAHGGGGAGTGGGTQRFTGERAAALVTSPGAQGTVVLLLIAVVVLLLRRRPL